MPFQKLGKTPKSIPEASEIRKHYFLDRYVVIAPVRKLRPDGFGDTMPSHKLETTSSPAIEKEAGILEIKGRQDWEVKVIENAYPTLTLDNPKAYGKQEIVIETPHHNLEFSELGVSHIEKVFSAYSQRAHALYQLPGIKYVVVFKNDGPKAGASIAHAHSQITAIPFIPPPVEHEAAAYDKYLRANSSCPVCDIVNWELKEKVRIIYSDRNIIALAPYAASAPFGAWIIPKNHLHQFCSLPKNVHHSIAIALKQICSKLDSAGISFNFFLQDSIPAQNHHFVLKVEPRSNVWGGFELATGVIFNPVAPEYSALWYRGKTK